jgi:hypothetical protein
MRITAIIIAALFALSAALQLNDPDPVPWFLAYALVALLWLLAATGRYYRPFTAVLLLVLAIWMFTLVPDFVAWVGMGMPSIVGGMKAEEPHIELVREFGGLVFAVLALAYLLRLGKRRA